MSSQVRNPAYYPAAAFTRPPATCYLGSFRRTRPRGIVRHENPMPKRPASKTRPRPPQPRDLAVAFVSLGCPKNLVDSEKMLGLLASDGIAVTDDHDAADAIVINTCGFLEASKTESLQVIRQALAAKRRAAKRGRPTRVVVAGCLVQRHKDRLLDEIPGVDALVGVFDRENIVNAVRGSDAQILQAQELDLGNYHVVSTFIHRPTRAENAKGYTDSDRARLRLTPRHYAYLRISEGCNQGCTFCTIPSIRGRMRSKPLPAILAEARELLADGARELNLIGQDTTSYGTDLGIPPGQGLPTLLRSLNKLATQHASHHAELKLHPSSFSLQPSPSLPWLRLLYAYPSCFTDEMIHTLADCDHFVKYIDIPLQHIDDHILHAMRRRVTRKQTETLLEKLRRHIPGIALRTTFISGFPGETDAQHAALLQFVKDFRFDNVGVFEFSPEPGTPAARLHQSSPVPAKIAARRKEEIMLAQQQIVFARNAALVGTTVPVLVDEIDPRKNTATARSPAQAPEIDATILLKNAPHASPGTFLPATITAFKNYDLIATPPPPNRLSLPILEGGWHAFDT
jgi:ribosomal protein S12 methylthiotransferase